MILSSCNKIIASRLRGLLELSMTDADSLHSLATIAELANLFLRHNRTNEASLRFEDNLGWSGFLPTVLFCFKSLYEVMRRETMDTLQPHCLEILKFEVLSWWNRTIASRFRRVTSHILKEMRSLILKANADIHTTATQQTNWNYTQSTRI